MNHSSLPRKSKFRRKLKRIFQELLSERNDLTALIFSNFSHCRKVVGQLRKKVQCPYDIIRQHKSIMLVVPEYAVQFVDGYIEKKKVISQRQLLKILKKEQKNHHWRHNGPSPVLAAIIHRKYFFEDMVNRNIAGLVEAARQAKLI